MNKGALSAILWKEKIIFFRNAVGLVFFYMILILFSNIYILSSYIQETSLQEYLDHIITNNLIMLAPTVFVAIGSVILSQSISIDKREGILKILIGNGTGADVIWLGKYIFSVFVCYVVLFICVCVYFFSLLIIFDMHIVMTKGNFMMIFFIMPVVSMFLLALYAFLFWITKNQTVQIFYSMFPAIIYLVSFYISDYVIDKKMETNLVLIILLCSLSILGIFMLSKCVKKYEIEKLV